ncbi:MAG: hypothetical protein V5A57_03625 [Candidatus Paceibacterota bacterium]
MAATTIWIIIGIVVVGLAIWYLLSGSSEKQGPTSKGPGSKPDKGPTSKPGQGPLGSDEGPGQGPSKKPPKGPSPGSSE